MDLLLYWAAQDREEGLLCLSYSTWEHLLGCPQDRDLLPQTHTSWEKGWSHFSSKFGYLPPQALSLSCNPDAQQPLNSLLMWESSFKKLSFKKLMCSQAVKLTKQKGHFPEQQEQFGAFRGGWEAGQAEHRLCRALSRAEWHTALWARALSEGELQVSEMYPPRNCLDTFSPRRCLKIPL